ncbi:nuclear mitotic apparatus protein 1-like [Falco peregrinus]|uniref:nuclear mitotic apparatus protein 1-like n=1 Tax=Falco peregrinus TaxID=8954 RepID=UPI00247A0331|nr:nuclear mitotic apparatus protein 1-like [Falco peregrinus]
MEQLSLPASSVVPEVLGACSVKVRLNSPPGQETSGVLLPELEGRDMLLHWKIVDGSPMPGAGLTDPYFQVEELNEKLTQHEKAVQTQEQRVKVLEGELQAEATHQQEKVAELQAQLTQKEQAAKHYKEQMEKAKMCYDAEKQQNQDLAEKLKAMEQLQKENAELRMESERLAKELEQSILQVRESELSCQNLTSQVCSLEAQVELANQQLQELGKFQGAADTLKGQETFCQNPADLSTDSLDLGVGEAQPLNATRKAGCPQLEASVPPGNEESLASKQLPRKAESLESLHFAPRHSHRQLHLGTSAHSLGDLSLHSRDKTPPTLKVSARPVAADTSRPERSASAAGAARIQAAAEGQRRGARCTRTERGSCCGRFPAPALRNEPRRPWRHRPSPPPASARSVPNTALRSPAAPAGGTRPPASPGGGSRCGKRPAAHPGRAGDPLLPPRQGRARARRAQPERPDGGEPRSVARAPMRVGESQRRGHGAPGREPHAAAPHRETVSLCPAASKRGSGIKSSSAPYRGRAGLNPP